MRKKIERLLGEEGGFTLAEMMVTIMVMIAVFFALHNVFDMSIRVFSFGNDKVEAVENARIGMERMKRELRVAYPVNKVYDPANPSVTRDHLFFQPGAPHTPALSTTGSGLAANQRRSVTFGNDLPQPSATPNRRIYDPATLTTDPGEQVTYKLNDSCPPGGSDAVCAVQRVSNGSASNLVEYVSPDDPDTAASNDGFTLTYLKNNGSVISTTNGSDVGVVRIKLVVNKDGRIQKLTTDVDLRNK